MNPLFWRGTAFRAALRGDALPPAPCGPREELEERADGDPDARAWLLALTAQAQDAKRIAAAIKLEQAPVPLPDGSRLTLDDAERQLARKEERQVHRPLRAAVQQVVHGAAADWFVEYRSDEINEIRKDPTPARRFLASSAGAHSAARDMLASIAHEPLHDADRLARALDLPSESGQFSEESTLALLAAPRALFDPLARPLRRLRVPRALAGCVVEGPDGVWFGTVHPTLRFERHVRTVRGGVSALWSAQGAEVGVTTSAAAAFGLGVSLAQLRRSVLQEKRPDAERAGRLAVAVALFDARAAVALLLSIALDGPSLEAQREALAGAWGCDPGEHLTAERASSALWLWPLVGAARELLQLRDEHDEGFVVRAEAWREARERAAPVSLPDEDAAAQAAAGWSRLVAELA